MDNSLKGLLLAAGILITVFVVGWGFKIARDSEDMVQIGSDKINQMTNEIMNSDVTKYEGSEISGSEVINVINELATDKIAIVVTNKAETTVAYGYNVTGTDGDYVLGTESSASIANAKDTAHVNYINPTKKFTGKLLYNKNEAVIGIHFTQK